jgi:hypothetical protein
MTYNPSTPQPPEIPSQSQSRFLTNFSLFNQYFGQDHTPPGNAITLATNAAPIVITSPGHALSTGNMVTVYDITGTEGNTPVAWPINGNTFTITVVDSNTFSLQGSDATNYPTYLAGTGNFSSASYLYGYHKQLTAANPLPNDPPSFIGGGSIYPKISLAPNGNPRFPNADFFFQNLASIVQLTRLFNNATPASQGEGTKWSFRTPWGVIINTGIVTSSLVGGTIIVDFPVPYITTNYGVVLSLVNATRPTTVNVNVSATSLTGFTFRASYNTGRAVGINTYYLSMGT